jgi:hypothetical protein
MHARSNVLQLDASMQLIVFVFFLVFLPKREGTYW